MNGLLIKAATKRILRTSWGEVGWKGSWGQDAPLQKSLLVKGTSKTQQNPPCLITLKCHYSQTSIRNIQNPPYMFWYVINLQHKDRWLQITTETTMSSGERQEKKILRNPNHGYRVRLPCHWTLQCMFRAQITWLLLRNIPQALSRRMKKSLRNGLMGGVTNMKMIMCTNHTTDITILPQSTYRAKQKGMFILSVVSNL